MMNWQEEGTHEELRHIVDIEVNYLEGVVMRRDSDRSPAIHSNNHLNLFLFHLCDVRESVASSYIKTWYDLLE